jgi:serine/threonine protein kinase
LVGWQFGPYRVETLLGRGGMGEVYRAYDASQDRIVALKLLAKQFAADEEYQERFRRESRAAARLRDPHVIPIHRYGEIDGRLFIDMRLVEGDSLATVLAGNGPMSPSRTALIVEQVASALDAAHADGLIHRDVKPSNVLLTRVPSTSNNDFVYLVDFGISRKLTKSQSPPLTEAGVMIGTPEYMAPERFVNGSISRQADVYALACVAYECLTARPPFPKEDLPALIYAHVNTSPPRPSSLCPGIPEVWTQSSPWGWPKTRPSDIPPPASLPLRCEPLWCQALQTTSPPNPRPFRPLSSIRRQHPPRCRDPASCFLSGCSPGGVNDSGSTGSLLTWQSLSSSCSQLSE